MRKFLLYGVTATALFWAKGVKAQDDSSGLDPVTVSASLSPQQLSRTGRNLFVFKGSQFSGLPVHSLDELLRYLPGLEVQARGPMGAQSDIVLRGGTFQQVLVVLDGVRLNDPNTGHFSSYIPIIPGEIDRIEVLKGASSAIYGSEAVGGVIHIITKAFAGRSDAKKFSASAQLTAGEYDLLNAQAGIQMNAGSTTFHAGLLTNNTSGQPQRGRRGYLNNHTASVSVGHRFSEQWSLSLRGAYDDRAFAAQNFYTNFASDTASETIKTVWTQLQVQRQTAGNRLRLQAGYKTLQDEYFFSPRSLPNFNESRLVQLLLTDEWKIRPGSVLTLGTQWISKGIESNDRGNHEVGQAAGFVSLSQQLGDNLTLNPALRLEYNERAGWELVPQLNLSFRTDDWQFRASGGKTIRDADFTERFNNYNKSFVASGRIGNPDLEAERSFSYEAGVDYFASGNLKLSATFFQRFHSRLIDYVPTPYSEMPRQANLSPTGTYALAKNLSEVTTTGAEADVHYSKQWSGRQSFLTTVGLVWLESRSPEATPSFYISSHARFLANFNLKYQYRAWSVALNGLYKVRQEQAASNPAIAKVSPDYFLLNGRVEAGIWKNRLALFVQVDNVFDRSYTDLLGAAMPGRWLMGGFKITL